MDKLLKERVDRADEKYFQLRTKGVFRPVTKQIRNSIADLKHYYERSHTGGVIVVPSDVPPHLSDVKEAILCHLNNPESFFFKKNILTQDDVGKLETSTERLLVLMDSLALAMAFEVKSRPCNVICDVLLAVCNQPVFVFTLVDGAPEDDHLRKYNNSVARGVTGKLKLFMDELICVVHGVCSKGDIEDEDLFCKTLKDHARISSIFIPEKTFETSLPKFNSILTAFWAGVAETNSVTTDHEKTDEDVKHFLTKDQCVLLLENINKREATVQHRPRSGATVLMLEVARRFSSYDITFACSSNKEKERLSSVYPNTQLYNDVSTFVSEAVRKRQRIWKFVQHSDTDSESSSVVLVTGERSEHEDEVTRGMESLHMGALESKPTRQEPLSTSLDTSKKGGKQEHDLDNDDGEKSPDDSEAGGYNALVQVNVNVTQQQFGDVTVENATNINQSFGGQQHISKTATFHEERKGAELSRTDLIMTRELQEPRKSTETDGPELYKPKIPADIDETKKTQIMDLWKKTQDEVDLLTPGMIHVSAVDKVVDMLKRGRNWVTITGNAGDGKTILGYLVMRQLRTSMTVFNIEEPEQYRLLSKLREDHVIMFDDRFGAFTSDTVLIDKWKSVIDDIHRRFDRNVTQTKVIFISRKNVVKEARLYLGHFQGTVLDPENLVDLSSVKNRDERLQILDYYLKHGGIKVSQYLKHKVVDLSIAHGFPHCAMMYSKLKAKKPDLDIESFFTTPINFLDITTEYLYEQNCKDLFDLMIKNDGRFNAYDMDDDERRRSLLKVEREQEGSYITEWKDGVCVFAHPSIYESVLSVICKTDPLFCVQHATLSVIRQKLTLTFDEMRKSPTLINVRPVLPVLRALAKRFRPEILEGDYSVFTHGFCDNEDFCRELLKACVYSGNDATEQNRSGGSDAEDEASGLGAASSVTVQDSPQEQTTRALADPDTLANQIAQHLVSTPGRGVVAHSQLQLESLPEATGSQRYAVHQHLTVNVMQQQSGDVSVEADTIGNMTLGGQQHIHQTRPIQQQKEETQQDGTSASNKTQERRHVDALDEYDDRTMLSTALLKNKTPAVLALVKHGANVNIDEGIGVTPLMHLYKQETVDIESMMYMITTGSADINQPDEIGVTPLHWLSRNSSVSVDDIKQLIVKGRGDINRPDDFGYTPLHYLCTRNLDIKSLVSLIQATGGKVNQADKTGNTSLHYLSVTNTQSADYLLKNIPGADGHAANVVGISPMDYLRGNAKPSHLYVTAPLTRTSEDLVIKLNGGDTESIPVQEAGGVSLISVLCRAMILNSERVHRYLQVEGRELHNMAESSDRETPNQFKGFSGTCSSPLPLPPSPSPISSPSYWETQCQLGWRERVFIGPLLEMGVKEGRENIDQEWFVSDLLGSVCVSVEDDCPLHTGHLCIQVMRRDQGGLRRHQVGECVTLPLPTSGEDLTFTFGLVLDVGRGRVGIVDVERGKLLSKIDKVFTQEVFPMFYVHPRNDWCATRMRLVSGREISVTDSKIKLIQQALSD